MIAWSLVTACSRCWLYPVIERTCGRSCVIYGVIIAPLRGSMAPVGVGVRLGAAVLG
jgi:hypothetical protein